MGFNETACNKGLLVFKKRSPVKYVNLIATEDGVTAFSTANGSKSILPLLNFYGTISKCSTRVVENISSVILQLLGWIFP